MTKLNSNDYKILSCVRDKESNRGLSIGRGSTILQIAEKSQLSELKVRKTIKILLEEEFIIEGVKNVRAKTYCITEKGFKALQELKTTII